MQFIKLKVNSAILPGTMYIKSHVTNTFWSWDYDNYVYNQVAVLP